MCGVEVQLGPRMCVFKSTRVCTLSVVHWCELKRQHVRPEMAAVAGSSLLSQLEKQTQARLPSTKGDLLVCLSTSSFLISRGPACLEA